MWLGMKYASLREQTTRSTDHLGCLSRTGEISPRTSEHTKALTGLSLALGLAALLAQVLDQVLQLGRLQGHLVVARL